MPKNVPEIEINPQFRRALDLLDGTSKNVFITGKAGTGKSTLLKYFREHTRKNIVVLAPTGVAALNVGGETIHSFFRFKPDITPDKVKKIKGRNAGIYRELHAIVIDEVSMVRADLLDCVDAFLRLNGPSGLSPFGGLQMIFIGDLYQLPPVVSSSERGLFSSHYAGPYFFNAKIFEDLEMEFLELEKVYRQKDAAFITILNSIRNNSATGRDLSALNKRVGAVLEKGPENGYAVHLLSTNKAAYEINSAHLHALKGEARVYRARTEGDFSKESYPADEELVLKNGAQVMLLNNEPNGRWVNGSMGEVVDITDEPGESGDRVMVRLTDGSLEKVAPHAWELFHFSYDPEAGKVVAETAGVFMQYPLKLAWGITIHKSQGKTFERAVIDFGRGMFAHGQAYVALSRCVSLEGMSLTRAMRKSDILMDRRVVAFITGHQYMLSDRALPLADKITLINEAIAGGKNLEITYLKDSDEKSRRVVKPFRLGKKVYMEREFLGMDCFCLDRKGERVFRVDRILELKLA
ncbi:MAG: AAA family ATPase [Elusimicrobia bacterium RIFOXYA12_FULL_51_18]|nr:MAG: AAA family ATPase [Elusimicrobia bacterium RIFOXYA12_FULL_51_18]OGS31918.1 MAG: AAA family ATPase [Elusimicrobia bacterium RIFOXYA2_FULL_53_38]